MTKAKKLSAKQLQAAQHQAEVLRLRLEGHSFREIAARINLSPGYCCKIIGRMLIEFQTDSAEQISIWRQLEIARTERQIRALWPKALEGSVSANEGIRKLTEQQCKILGLFAPVRIAPTSPDETSEYTGGGLSSLLRDGEL